jgi:predicted amidohydrolase YtcJ
MSLPSAVRAFTMGSAYVNGAEAVSGSIAPGKSADFMVLDSNPFAGPREEIWRTRVKETWFAGEQVYPADALATSFGTSSMSRIV